jgi:hypothetical protein
MKIYKNTPKPITQSEVHEEVHGIEAVKKNGRTYYVISKRLKSFKGSKI